MRLYIFLAVKCGLFWSHSHIEYAIFPRALIVGGFVDGGRSLSCIETKETVMLLFPLQNVPLSLVSAVCVTHQLESCLLSSPWLSSSCHTIALKKTWKGCGGHCGLTPAVSCASAPVASHLQPLTLNAIFSIPCLH